MHSTSYKRSGEAAVVDIEGVDASIYCILFDAGNHADAARGALEPQFGVLL